MDGLSLWGILDYKINVKKKKEIKEKNNKL